MAPANEDEPHVPLCASGVPNTGLDTEQAFFKHSLSEQEALVSSKDAKHSH